MQAAHKNKNGEILIEIKRKKNVRVLCHDFRPNSLAAMISRINKLLRQKKKGATLVYSTVIYSI